MQFKEEALVIKSVTLWHWQNWSSDVWVGETKLHVHWRIKFPRESRITRQELHYLRSTVILSAVSQLHTYLVVFVIIVLLAVEFTAKSTTVLQVQVWFFGATHLSASEGITTRGMVELESWIELKKTFDELSLSWNLGTPHWDLTLYKQAFPFLILLRRHCESPTPEKDRFWGPHCFESKGQTLSFSARVLFSYLLEQLHDLSATWAQEVLFWQQNVGIGADPAYCSGPFTQKTYPPRTHSPHWSELL